MDDDETRGIRLIVHFRYKLEIRGQISPFQRSREHHTCNNQLLRLNLLIITHQQGLLLIIHPQLPVNILLVLPHRGNLNLQRTGNLLI